MTSSNKMIVYEDTSQTVSIIPSICNSIYDITCKLYHLQRQCEKIETQFERYKKNHNEWKKRGGR